MPTAAEKLAAAQRDAAAAARDAARAAEYASLFKNALVYSVVMSNVRVIMDGHDGSVSLLVLCFIVAATVLFRSESAAALWESDLLAAAAGPGEGPSGLMLSISSLLVFLLSLGSNLAVQFTSQLVGELAARSLAGATVEWSLFGSVISILFVFVMQKVAAGATLPCTAAITPEALKKRA